MRCAIYCRLSREDENKADESESIQNQRLLLHQYAEDRGWTVCAEYIDDDRSGVDPDRPGFRALLRDAEAGRFDVLLCKTQSRFTRDLELSEHYLHRRFSEWGVRFISVVDGVDTGRRDNLKARQLGGLINEWYLADLSDNVRAVLDAKRRRGDFIGSFAPYGYRKSQTERGKLEPDPEAAAVVREIFKLAGEGYSCAEIARQLTARAIPNPTVYKLQKGEKYFNGRGNPHGSVFKGVAGTVISANFSGGASTNTFHTEPATAPPGRAQERLPASAGESIQTTQTAADSANRSPDITSSVPHNKPIGTAGKQIRLDYSESSGCCENAENTPFRPGKTEGDSSAAHSVCSAEWSRSTVSRILRSECYLGAVVQGKREKVSYKSKRLRERRRSEWIVVYGVNEPIITREEFERAQAYRRK